MPPLDRSRFLRDLKDTFPALRPALNAQRGQLHFEMDVFRRYVQQAIERGDREGVSRCYALAATYLAHGNAAMRTAIDVSFVEPLHFGAGSDVHSWAWEAMPSNLQAAYLAFHRRTPG